MAADIGKIISSKPQHHGGAVTSPPGTLGVINSVRYGADFDIDSFAARVAKKWKIRGYYYTSNPYNSDVTSDAVVGTANTDTEITYAADPYGSHVIEGVGWSYSGGAPTTGKLTVESPSGTGTAVYTSFIAGSGQGYISFPDAIRGDANTSMNVRLWAGGSGIVGTLNVFGHRVE